MQHKISKIRNHARTAAFVLHSAQQRATSILLFGIVLFAFLYVYFVGSAVMHAVVRKEVQQEIAQTSSQIADLEVDYLQRKNAVTEDRAAELGYTHVAYKGYVERERYLGQANVR